MNKILTKKQEELFNLIATYIKGKGISPTVRELSIIMGNRSTSTTHNMIKQLEKKGVISKIEGSPRSIRIT